MTDLDLERLGDVWRRQPDPKELEELRLAAETVRARARRAQVADVTAAIVVAGVMGVMIFYNPQIDTFVLGGAAILILIFSQLRQRKIRQLEMQSLAGNAEEMLEQSIARVQGTLKRARYGLIALWPAMILGVGVAYVADRSGALVEWVAQSRWLGPTFNILAGGAVAATALHLYRSLRSSRAQLRRLIALHDAFKQERESSLSDD